MGPVTVIGHITHLRSVMSVSGNIKRISHERQMDLVSASHLSPQLQSPLLRTPHPAQRHKNRESRNHSYSGNTGEETPKHGCHCSSGGFPVTCLGALHN